ncbi:MAG: hypothetical protein AB7V34_00610 [Brachymonas sp.]
MARSHGTMRPAAFLPAPGLVPNQTHGRADAGWTASSTLLY